MLGSGEEREGCARIRFPSLLCSDDGYGGGAMLAKLRPCTDVAGVQRDGAEKERRAAAAGRKRGGGLGFGEAEGVL